MAGRSSEDQRGINTKATHSEGSGGGRLGQSWAETELTRGGQLVSLFQERREGRGDHRRGKASTWPILTSLPTPDKRQLIIPQREKRRDPWNVPARCYTAKCVALVDSTHVQG